MFCGSQIVDAEEECVCLCVCVLGNGKIYLVTDTRNCGGRGHCVRSMRLFNTVSLNLVRLMISLELINSFNEIVCNYMLIYQGLFYCYFGKVKLL